MSRRAGALAAVVTLVLAASASGASRVDGSVAIGALTSKPHAGRVFVLGVTVDGGEGSDTGYSFKLTLSASPRIAILRASSTFTQLHCEAVAATLECAGRNIADPISSIVYRLRAAKAGKYKLTAQLVIDGDTNAANDSASRTIIVKPKLR